jgi:SOS-response transcriptional repressor LexA
MAKRQMNEYKVPAEQVGAFLREKREAQGYLQSQVAEFLDMKHSNYIHAFESGKTDVRKSRYFPGLVRILGITAEELRERVGLDILIGTDSNPEDTLPMPIGATRPSGAVLLRHLGSVQAGVPSNGVDQARLKHRVVECPLKVARKYQPEELYVLDVDGDSMTSIDVQKTIPQGSSILVRAIRTEQRTLEPRPGQIVVAWIPEVGDDGIGVIKYFGKKGEEFVLESYNNAGPRFPASKYPKMRVQGIVLGFWFEFGE